MGTTVTTEVGELGVGAVASITDVRTFWAAVYMAMLLQGARRRKRLSARRACVRTSHFRLIFAHVASDLNSKLVVSLLLSSLKRIDSLRIDTETNQGSPQQTRNINKSAAKQIKYSKRLNYKCSWTKNFKKYLQNALSHNQPISNFKSFTTSGRRQ